MKHLGPDVLNASRDLTTMEKLRLVLEVCALRAVVWRIMRRRARYPCRPSKNSVVGSPGPERGGLAALTALLARRGIASRVVIGVRKEAPAGALSAHAWVTIGGRAVSPPGDHAELADL